MKNDIQRQTSEYYPLGKPSSSLAIFFSSTNYHRVFFIVTEASCFAGASCPKLEASGTLKYGQAGAWPSQQELRQPPVKRINTGKAPWESQAPAWLILFLLEITIVCFLLQPKHPALLGFLARSFQLRERNPSKAGCFGCNKRETPAGQNNL